MTAVANPPAFTQHNRPAWGMNGMNGGHPGIVNPDELNRMLMPHRNLPRSNSSSSISSISSVSSTSTIATPASQSNGATSLASGDATAWSNGATVAQRKRPQPKSPWSSSKPDPQSDFVRMSTGRPQLMNGLNGSASLHATPSIPPSQGQVASQQAMPRPMIESLPSGNPPVLHLLSLNSTFERKTITVPFTPDSLRIGRQTNAKTVPTPINGFFDSKVLSRQHAEIWADRQGKIFIRDVKSSNGTFVNGTRLSQENRESEPHELQSGDHLELGIDIVSEDQKTVVHHKVAAKVEYAGFAGASGNLLDVNFVDLDPTNNSMMMGSQNAAALRQRAGSQSSMVNNGRMVQGGPMTVPQTNAMGYQRGFFFSSISTEQIVKKLQSEMRNARIQSQDLGRTDHFINTLLSSKEDVKDIERLDAPDPTKSMINGGGVSFRSDNKTRFSDPPAPPPQQPLPEKPDISLRRSVTERAKSHSQSMSPIRHDSSGSQILQLTEALSSAKKEIESQTSRVRDLEEMLLQERQARELAEDLARRLERHLESAANPVSPPPTEPETTDAPPDTAPEPPNGGSGTTDINSPMPDAEEDISPNTEVIEASATHLHAQIESLVLEIQDLRHELDVFKQRAETAESERDNQRKTLAEMALQIRQDAQARELVEKEKMDRRNRDDYTTTNGSALINTGMVSRSRSRSRLRSNQGRRMSGSSHCRNRSRSATITPNSLSSPVVAPNKVLANSIPYASMIGVVLIGMGLMAYINGWQPQGRLER
ncbi:hypothetical protein GGS21DRAFT_539758 [Xylaria nigripes]|nr:hypothetical protein GGS21DRAFT_539758 [Xylaria nigripes]